MRLQLQLQLLYRPSLDMVIFSYLNDFTVNFSFKKFAAAHCLVALSTTAMADSSVSIYGRIDTSLQYAKVGTARTYGIANAGSHFGFIGTESLGSGLTVGFQLESAFESDTGTGAVEFFGNRSELFVQGPVGTVRLGRFLNPSYYAVADRVSLHNEDFGITADMLYTYMGRDANRMAYKSPVLSGWILEGSVSWHERQNGNAQDKNAYDLVASYERGRWSVAGTYGEQGAARQYGLRATWSKDPWVVSAYHQRSEHWDMKQQAVNLADGPRSATRAAVAYFISSGEIHMNFGHASGQGPQEANQWTVGYNHRLSKRTKLYAFYTAVKNKGGASYGLSEMTANQDLEAINIGIRHLF